MSRAGAIIAIILVLTCSGLVMEAARNVRQAQARVHCVTNLKTTGMGLRDFHDVYKKFPAATASDIGHRKLTVPLVPFEERVSWIYNMSVFESKMGMNWFIDLSKSWDAEENRHVVDVPVAWFLCPANSLRGDNGAWTHYVGIAGVGNDAINVPKTDANAGIFGYRRTIANADVTDGVSNTIAVAETAQDNGPWAKPGRTSVRGLEPDGGTYLGRNGQFNSHHFDGRFDRRYFINVALADGSVKTLSDAISPGVFESLATIAGGEEVEAIDW